MGYSEHGAQQPVLNQSIPVILMCTKVWEVLEKNEMLPVSEHIIIQKKKNEDLDLKSWEKQNWKESCTWCTSVEVEMELHE
jgi:hypothetical protein